MTLTFIRYTVADTGIQLAFNADYPGPGRENEIVITLTDAELAGISTQVQLRALVTNKLNRKIRASGIATKLDPFIGQSLTI